MVFEGCCLPKGSDNQLTTNTSLPFPVELNHGAASQRKSWGLATPLRFYMYNMPIWARDGEMLWLAAKASPSHVPKSTRAWRSTTPRHVVHVTSGAQELFRLLHERSDGRQYLLDQQMLAARGKKRSDTAKAVNWPRQQYEAVGNKP